ncbi:hypothetical protein ACFQ67_20340 [Streptomyces sp. NPDC056488]|uniref:hypothetical protein n=1 Tax=Streptomyces sp. NPDC056488 TaxID=3345836 RepID=UPI0036895A10
MRDHDTAEREAAAEAHGTTARHETTDRPGHKDQKDQYEAADRPGVTDRSGATEGPGATGRPGVTERPGTAERSGVTDRADLTTRPDPTDRPEKTGPFEKAERREGADRDPAAERSPVPAERGTASAQEPGLPGQGARRPVQAPRPEEQGVRPGPLSSAVGHGDDEHVPDLLNAADGEAYRERWREVQGRFVDDPREAVHSADELVADVMKTLAAAFAEHKQTLEGQWSEGREADTEALRVALREYRSFFNRLLTTSAPQR